MACYGDFASAFVMDKLSVAAFLIPKPPSILTH
jgi:hypothetical protein